jgi:hypothetical protein
MDEVGEGDPSIYQSGRLAGTMFVNGEASCDKAMSCVTEETSETWEAWGLWIVVEVERKKKSGK